jgi:hypothetical protein
MSPNQMTILLASLIAICCAVAISNWRLAMYLGIVVDVLRDPIRKLTIGEPAWMTQAMIPVWFCIFAGCLAQQPGVVRQLGRVFPGVRKGTRFLLLALLPGLFLSLVLYTNGWFVAAIGGLSYVGPLAGILIGACMAIDKRDVLRVLRFYALINSVALVGSLAESSHWGWPALGGMQGFEWIRHMPGVQVRLISGFFRSPDIAGFHAANVLVFSVILSLPKNRGDRIRPAWLVVTLWGVYVITLAGRRKMLAIPLLFIVVFFGLNAFRKQKKQGASSQFLLVAVLALGGFVAYSIGQQTELESHATYYSTTLVDAVPRLYASTFSSTVNTLSQSGFLGSGLGVASQGAQHAGIDLRGVWQEDGMSRVFKELGVIGAFLLLMAVIAFVGEFRKALRTPLNEPSRTFLQTAGLGIAAGHLGCFVISHQHISGDASNGVWAILFLGGVFGHAIADLRSRPASPLPGAAPNPQSEGTNTHVHRSFPGVPLK